MRAIKFILAIGLCVCIVGFLVDALAINKDVGEALFLFGFLFIVVGFLLLAFRSSKGVSGVGLRIIAGGFTFVAVGVMIAFFSPSINVIGNVLFDVGGIIMLGGILLHLFVRTRSRQG